MTRSVLPSPEGVSVVRGLSPDPVLAAAGSVSAEDRVLVAVQLRLRHHQARVVIGAAVFDTCTNTNFGGCVVLQSKTVV